MQIGIEIKKSAPLLPCDHYAGSRKFLIKALALRSTFGGLFDITLDLEDGAKATGRLSLAEDLLEEAISPIHNIESIGFRLPFFRDPLFLRVANLYFKELGAKIRSITIPKLRSASEFLEAKSMLQQALPNGEMELPPLHILIENSEILPELSQIASDPLVETLEIGVMDFISSFQGNIQISECDDLKEFSNSTINYLKSAVICTAASYNLTPVHNVSREFTDLKKLKEFCSRARQIGFARMWSIHPAQIPIIIEAFSPTQGEIDEAHLILSQAQEEDWGPISFAKKLHDLASYRFYAHVLQRAAAFGMKVPADSLDLASQIKPF